MTDYDAIVIGANTTVLCASYLARAKHAVLVIDAPVPGGCASTREFAENYRVSDCAQWLSQLDKTVIGPAT